MRNIGILQRASAIVGMFLFVHIITSGTAIAGSASGTWYKNGATMRGSHNAYFVGGLDRRIDANSNITIPPGSIQSISVYGYLQDRCKNANGTWQPWNQFASGGNTGYWTSTVSTTQQGTYQNCTYGHQYKNLSLHLFYMPSWSLNESYWLCSSDQGVC